MQIIKSQAIIESYTPDLERVIEAAGRTCWKSEGKITKDSAPAFIKMISNYKHESVLEHGAITVRFICDRGVSHELVRHRIASFSQESTRYCNYGKDKFGEELTFIEPCFWNEEDDLFHVWLENCRQVEDYYLAMLEMRATPQEARSILPNSLKTEVVMTANPREWKHVFALRCSPAAHPQMREIMIPLRKEFQARWPSIFGDNNETE